MPKPNKKLSDTGLWDKGDMPSKLEYRVLCHLAAFPDSRVYLRGDYGAAVTNSETHGVVGWTTHHGCVHHIRHGALSSGKPWVALDKVATRQCQHGFQAYKITNAGIEAIAQYDARLLYEHAHLQLASRILRLTRRQARALIPR